MENNCELKVLFATNYTDACFRAIRSVSQLADAFQVSLTIAHVGPARQGSQKELQSFFAEADHYHACNRVQLSGSTTQVLAELARQGKYDLVLAPRSDRLGMPRPFHRSTRAALLGTGCSPLWTGSRGLEGSDFLRPYSNIAVCLSGNEEDLTHLELARKFAERVGARLKLLTIVPALHEGTLLAHAVAPEPLSEEAAVQRIERMLADWSVMPAVEVAIGSLDRELPRLAARCEADLLFLSEAQTCAGFFSRRVSRAADHSPCNVISVPASLPDTFRWSFEHLASEPEWMITRRESRAGRTTQPRLTLGAK